MTDEHIPDYSVIPPTGAHGHVQESGIPAAWPSKFVLPQGPSGSFSVGGWTEGNEGFIQQTFLGASIRNFNITGGFGDTSSNLSVELIEDEFNKSDGTFLGLGDDVYHSGNNDKFIPPPVGTPVFFKFGQNWATVEQAYRRTIEETYNITEKDGVVIDREAWEFKRDKKDDWTPHPESGYDIVESGAFSRFPFEGSGEWPNSREKYYLRAEGYVKDAIYSDLDDPRDDRRYYVDKGFLYEHDNLDRGYNHFVFGGILQSVVESRSPNGNPLYSVQVTDPREILGNCIVVLNDYAGTTFNNKNLYNVYGFLEYDPSDELQKRLDEKALYKWIIEKQVDPSGKVAYFGRDKDKGVIVETVQNSDGSFTDYKRNPSPYNWDVYKFPQTLQESTAAGAGKTFEPAAIDYDTAADSELYPKFFPITGEGFCRRSDQGIPWYRVSQGLAALFEYYGKLPKEYREAGFGGTIDFRGFNYIVDFGGIPLEKIPMTYMMDYNQIDLLSLAQELCDVISHDLFVSLLPVIDPLTEPKDDDDEKAALMNYTFAKNNFWMEKANAFEVGSEEYNKYISNIVHGVIRLDAIDRSKQPSYGSIQTYINRLEERGIRVENRDLGFELTNVTTDKFVVGAQQVDMYYFSTHKDRDTLEFRKSKAGLPNALDFINEQQWTLEASLKQQVLPFYGFLGKNALSIPRGFGSYQQIMLDATALDAYGVGNYYIATEIELRHAIMSYSDWVDFLMKYNDTYVEEMGELKGFYKELAKGQTQEIEGLGNPQEYVAGAGYNISQLLNRDFGVSVPRCVFNSDKNFMGEDRYPASPCSPPYGYPLYFKRAEKIGISKAGIAKIQDLTTRVRTNLQQIQEFASEDPSNNVITYNVQSLQKEFDTLNDLAIYGGDNFTKEMDQSRNCIYDQIRELEGLHTELIKAGENVGLVDSMLKSVNALQASLSDMGVRSERNAKKVYEFVRNIAEQNLGKKFLVKIPRYCNVNYSEQMTFRPYFSPNDDGSASDVTSDVGEIYKGPFGFKPMPVSASGKSLIEDQNYLFKIEQIRSDQDIIKTWNYERFLYKDNFQGIDSPATLDKTYGYGALKGNYNPINEKWAFNYKPEPRGGFFDFGLFPRKLSLSLIDNLGIKEKNLCPATQYHLTPKDLSNFVSEDGRISCYVRYDNSQYLDFRGISADSIAQEFVQGNIFIPDVISELDNVDTQSEDQESIPDYTRRESGPNKKPKAVTYVKCDVDENLYMPPKTEKVPTLVFAREIRWIPNYKPPTILQSQDEETGCPIYKCILPYAEPIFEPAYGRMIYASDVGYEKVLPPSGAMFDTETFEINNTFGKPSRIIKNGGFDNTIVMNGDYVRRYDKNQDSFIVDTETQNLDSDHVYALITIPGKVESNINQRYVDSHLYNKNSAMIKNYMTQDVVRGPEGFEKPYEIVNKKVALDCNDFTFEQLESAQKAQRASISNVLAQQAATIAHSVASPVFPNLIALPLLSHERCYGPWRSAANLDGSKDRYSDIGGKVEFVKDENLAPWNYAGYQLMNEAGNLQAEFSNSLLLFSERGGFVFPSTPSGISLGRSLQEGGPLVTSVSINVSEAGVKTTVKMDLYTSRFGRLQKQKEGAIAQITRERQKIIDNNNQMIRKGLIKSATSSNINAKAIAMGNNLINDFSQLDKEPPPVNYKKVVSVSTRQNGGTNLETGQPEIKRENYTFSSNMTEEQINRFLTNQGYNDAQHSYQNSAAEQEQVPFSESPHPDMPYQQYVNVNATSANLGELSTPSDLD